MPPPTQILEYLFDTKFGYAAAGDDINTIIHLHNGKNRIQMGKVNQFVG